MYKLFHLLEYWLAHCDFWIYFPAQVTAFLVAARPLVKMAPGNVGRKYGTASHAPYGGPQGTARYAPYEGPQRPPGMPRMHGCKSPARASRALLVPSAHTKMKSSDVPQLAAPASGRDTYMHTLNGGAKRRKRKTSGVLQPTQPQVRSSASGSMPAAQWAVASGAQWPAVC